MTTTIRQRIGVSTSVKGIKSYDCTVEITSDELTYQEAKDKELKASDALVAELDKRYPPPEENK